MARIDVLHAALLERRVLEATPAQAAAWTGLSLEDAQAGLLELVERYPARVLVGERGTLLVRFAALDTPRRGAAPLLSWLARNAAALEALAVLLLLPAFLLTLACHAAALDAVAAGWGLAGLPLRLVAWVVLVPALLAGMATFIQLYAAPAMVLVAIATLLGSGPLAFFGDEAWGLLAPAVVLMGLCGGVGAWLVLRHFVFGERNLAALGLGQLVAGTVFGPLPELASFRRQVAALIASRGGVLTLADLMGTFGWTRDEAEARLGRILADYQGELIVTDEGALVLRFQAMAAAPGRAPAPAWERTPPAFWDSPQRFRQALAAACAVGLAGLLANRALAWFPPMHPWGADGLVASFGGGGHASGLGVWPYVAIALPVLLRLPLWQAARRRYEARRPFLQLLKLAVTPPHGRYLKAVPPGAAALGADVDLDATRADGRMLVTFPELQRATRAADQLRHPPEPEALAYDSQA